MTSRLSGENRMDKGMEKEEYAEETSLREGGPWLGGCRGMVAAEGSFGAGMAKGE